MVISIDDERLMLQATKVVVTDDSLIVDLEDGRQISTPLVWYPRLVHGTPAERNNVEIGHYGIHWPDLDEDLSIKGLLLGHKSGEGQKSLSQWLEFRQRGEKVPVLERPLPDWIKEADSQ